MFIDKGDKVFQGVFTALVTPFRKGKVDEDALRQLVDRQIQAGVHGLVVCGTTGEAAAMSSEEKQHAIRAVVEQSRGRVSVIAGTGSYNTATTIEATKQAASLGVDAALVVTPYYVKPPQRGLLEHYKQIAKLGLAVVAYNVPSRTGVSLSVETVREIAQIPNVVALKEASGNMVLGAEIIGAAGDKFAVLSGDDGTFLPLLSLGGAGCVSVLSNVAPRQTVEIYEAFVSGDVARARSLHVSLLPLVRALFLESNPIPVKAALSMMGQVGPEIRTPLCVMEEKAQRSLRGVLQELGLLG